MEYKDFTKEYHAHNLHLYQMDCMDLLKQTPDNYYNLCIVDPPYGMHRKMDGGDGAGRIMRKFKRNKPSWDLKPDREYFEELFRVSKNQIIWGGNNFIENLYNTTGFIFWYKHQPAPNFADGELAWTSFQIPARCFDYMCFGAHGHGGITKTHPTQKPVQLYKWLLKNYAKEGDKILDTHLGSCSIAIAVHEMNKQGMNLTLTGCELDEDYYNQAMKRVENACLQMALI